MLIRFLLQLSVVRQHVQQFVYTGVTLCDPSSLCVTLLCSRAKIDVCRSYDLTLTIIIGPGEQKYEREKERKFHLWYVSSWERKYEATKVPVTVK